VGTKAPRDIEVTRPDKLLWPDLSITKRAYVAYLDAVAPHMLPWLRERPLTVVRAPDGVEGQRYFQKSASSHMPSWIPTVRIAAPSAKRDVDYVLCNDAATLAWLGNQAALEFHPAPVRADRLDRLDLLTVDIDPPEGAFGAAAEVAVVVLEVLGDLGMDAGVKTTGGKGLHVVVPIERRLGQAELRRAAAHLTRIVAERLPEAVTEEFRKADRAGRVLLDPSRNGAGATVVAPYSPRIRPQGTVSFPITPEQLGSVVPEDFTLATVPGLLNGPGPRRWDELADRRSRIPKALLADD